MTIAIIIVIAVVLVFAVGLLIFKLMGKAQTAVPAAADQAQQTGERVVGLDERGRTITEAQETPDAPRDESAFEDLLRDEISDLGMSPPGDDEA